MKQPGDRLFDVSVKLPLIMAYTTPDLFEYACRHNLFDYDSGRYLINHLTYVDDTEYPSYIEFPVIFHTYESSKICDIIKFDNKL